MSKKVSHHAAKYRPADNDRRRCGTCSMYVKGEPSHCTLVEDPIKAEDVCKYYERSGK